MKVGTKSVLFGAHCFCIHPLFVALAWWKLYGFPRDYRLWVAFFVHDLGYWGKPNMDGPEGEKHVELGANLMHRLFDGFHEEEALAIADLPLIVAPFRVVTEEGWLHDYARSTVQVQFRKMDWRNFCLYHSRFYSKRDGAQFSRLCVADKLAVCIEPRWFYRLRVILSGEVHEYLAMRRGQSKYTGEPHITPLNHPSGQGFWSEIKAWDKSMCTYMRAWVTEHRDCRPDTWTPVHKDAA